MISTHVLGGLPAIRCPIGGHRDFAHTLNVAVVTDDAFKGPGHGEYDPSLISIGSGSIWDLPMLTPTGARSLIALLKVAIEVVERA
jgi:hypothetical protein